MIQRVRRLSCGLCGVQQRVKINEDTGEESPCHACGPTTWIAFPTIRVEPEPELPWPFMHMNDAFIPVRLWVLDDDEARRRAADELLDRDPDSPERQPWWYDE